MQDARNDPISLIVHHRPVREIPNPIEARIAVQMPHKRTLRPHANERLGDEMRDHHTTASPPASPIVWQANEDLDVPRPTVAPTVSLQLAANECSPTRTPPPHAAVR